MKNNLRKIIETDVFDHLILEEALSSYGSVRGKINRLLASGEIIRVKKGIYVFPEYLRRDVLDVCVLANMIYGPSYVSADFALARYGLIPETVKVITSVTTGRSRTFSTPLGRFDYRSRLSADYCVGFTSAFSGLYGYLIATPEKAIYDKAALDSRFDGTGIEEYLEDDLRIDRSDLERLNVPQLEELHAAARGRMKKLTSFLLEINR